MSSRPPNGMVNSSIEYSALLTTRTSQRYKHQPRDSFNRHRRLHARTATWGFANRHVTANMSYNPPQQLSCLIAHGMTFDEASKLIKKGDIIQLRQGLQEGLSPNLANKNSWTLLMIAAFEGNTAIGSLLIESGAELDARSKDRNTALSLAAHRGHASFVELLLTSGASLECHPFGNTFDDWLHWACQYGRCSGKIRGLFDNERRVRAERDHVRDQLR